MALERGLPENATWAEITRFDDNAARKNMAKELRLPETATWEDIQKAKDRK